ncbi:hypothetical protein CAL7716_040910 [Calothrix sp. PCC 7716]|nr:hypothetical protein CAL7716_040910 [Calothrix sp. PCC 7716]
MRYPNLDVQFAVAQNSQTFEQLKMQVLEALVNTKEEKIIEKLAKSANTPVSILEKIALSERYQDKFEIKLRRILARKPNQDNRESIADCYMDEIHKIIIEHQASVDAEQWLTIIASYQWTTLIENYTYFGKLIKRFHEDKDFSEYLVKEWSDLLPTLTEQPLQKIISNVLEMSDTLSEVVKGDRSIAVALVGNPSTPVKLREELEERLTKPIEKLSSHDGDSDMRMALAYNSQIPKKRRLEYFQQLLTARQADNIACNPNTPPEIIAQIMTKGVGRQAVSRNPNAPISALIELAQDDNRLTRSQIAENPATPSDILIQLARQPIEENINGWLEIDKSVREAAFKNPNFPLLERYKILLETEEAQEIESANQLMACRPDSPYAATQIVQKGDQKAKLTAARNQTTPVQVLEQLAKDADENIKIAVIQNKNTPSNSLLELACNGSYNVQICLARSRHFISRDVFLELLQHSESQIRVEIAKNSNTPVDILTSLAQDNDRNVKVTALSNPNFPSTVLSQIMPQIQDEKEIEQILRGQSGTGKRNSHIPTDVLERLSQHPKDTIRYLVANYNIASATTLERLAVDKYELVRKNVAENPSTPANVLIEMARRDELVTNTGCYHSISNKIAMRKDAPPEALEFIARKPVSPVRAVVAANVNTPSSALEWLAENESDEGVLCIVVRHPNITLNVWNHLATNESPKVREAVATQAQCPSNILTALADDLTQEVRQKVGANPNTPLHILESFSLDENPAIRQATASNPNLPETLLAQLANDEKVEVRRAVALNPSTPIHTRETLRDLILQPTTRQTSFTLRGLSRIYNPSTDDLPTILTEYAQSENAFVRFITLLHPLTPQDILNQGAESASWLERYAVADNPATSTQIKQQLTEDSNRIVRATAIANS